KSMYRLVCTGGNPREATLEDIVELYHTAW
ncbi:hypothetical protein, partial [Escherichia coli]